MRNKKAKAIVITIWVLACIGTLTIMDLFWQAIDTVEFGSPQPSIADSIFGAGLAYLIVEKIIHRI